MKMPEIGSLHEDEFRALKLLLMGVLSHDGDHYIIKRRDSPPTVSMTIKPSKSNPKITYTISFLDGTESAIAEPIVCRSDLDRRLSHQGYSEGCLDFGQDAFKLSPSGLARLREAFPPSNSDVMRYIGHELFAAWNDDPTLIRYGYHIEVDSFCERRNITPKQFKSQSNLLNSLGYGKFSGHAENQVHEGYLWLTAQGLDWAMRGFPSLSESAASPITVEVQVLNQYIQQVEQLPIDPEVKERFELLMRRIDDEKEKSDPSYKPVQDALDMMSKVKELWPLGVKFLADYGPTIARMAGHVPGM